MSALIRVTFELAITLKLSHYSVTAFSTKVNANELFLEECRFFELPEEVISETKSKSLKCVDDHDGCADDGNHHSVHHTSPTWKYFSSTSVSWPQMPRK